MLDESLIWYFKGFTTMRIHLILLASYLTALPPPSKAAPRAIKDIVFAEVDGHKLKLDLYLPEGRKPPSTRGLDPWRGLAVGLQG